MSVFATSVQVAIAYNVGTNNFTITGNWAGNVTVSPASAPYEDSNTVQVNIRDRFPDTGFWCTGGTAGTTTLFSNYYCGLVWGASTDVFTVSQTGVYKTFSSNISKALIYDYLNDAGQSFNLESFSVDNNLGSNPYVNVVKTQTRNKLSNLLFPYSQQEAAHDEVKDPTAPSTVLINVAKNFTPIADATVLSVNFNVCGNELTMTQALNTDGYKIYRSTDGVTYTLIGTNVGLANTSYIDTTSVLGTTYYYKVETYNSVWFEDIYTNKSNVINGASSYTAPTPSSVVGTECTMTNVVSWTDNVTCESAYKVYRSTDNTTYTLLDTLSPNTASYEDNTVNVNQIYYYKIVSEFSQYGLSYTGGSASNTLVFNAPSGLTVERYDALSIKIDWLLNTTCESQVLVERRTGTGGTWTQIASLANGSITYNDYTVFDNYTYYYRVRVSKASTSQYSNYSNEDSYLFTSFYIYNGANNNIYSVEVDASDRPYIGGAFTTYYDGTSANRIAGLLKLGVFNTSFSYTTGFNGIVWHVLHDSVNDLYYVAGEFTTYKGVAANRIICLNPDGSKNSGFDNSTGFNGTVYKLAFDNNGKIYAVGAFTTYKAVAANYAIRLNTDGSRDTGFVIGAGFANGFSAAVYTVAIEPSTNKVYFGGSFQNYKNYTSPFGYGCRYIAKVNSDGTVDTAFNSTLNSTWFNSNVHAILVDASEDVFVGGNFTSYGGFSLGRAVKINSTGTRDATFFVTSGFNGLVRDIIHDPTDIYVYFAGDFTTANGNPAPKIAKLRDNNASPELGFLTNVGTGFNLTTYNMKFDSDNHLYVVGSFTSYNGLSYNRIIKLDRDGNSITWATPATNQTTLLSASGVTATQVNLVWQTVGVQIITGNTIYRRKLSNPDFDIITSVAASATTYTVTETIDDDYAYKIVANRATGGSESNTLILPYINFTPNIARSAQGLLDISWINSSSYATDVEIFVSNNSGSSYSLLTSYPNTTIYYHTGLSEDVYRYYKLKYKNGSNVTSYFSGAASGLTYLNTPTFNSVIQPVNGIKEFDLSWSDNSSKETGYEIYRREKDVGSYVLIHTTSANVSTYTDNTLPTFGITYQYYIKAVKGIVNESLPSIVIERKLENVTLTLRYNVTFDDNLIDRNINLSWVLSGSCTGNTYSIYKSYDGINYGLLTTTTGSSYIDEERFETCQECNIVYYYVTIYCINLITSNTAQVIIEPPKTKWNLGGIQRLWIGTKPDDIFYSVVDATYETLDYYGNNIMTINSINNFIQWYELPVSQNANYTQKLNISNQGYVFGEVLELEVPKLNPLKWNDIQNLLGDYLIVVFQTNNGDYCIMGYDSPAEVKVFEATTVDSKYNFTIEVNHNYNLLKFISSDYVTNNIL